MRMIRNLRWRLEYNTERSTLIYNHTIYTIVKSHKFYFLILIFFCKIEFINRRKYRTLLILPAFLLVLINHSYAFIKNVNLNVMEYFKNDRFNP